MLTRARQDIQTAVAFLTTRVKNPDEDDWGKLKRVLKYLNGMRYLKLKLSMDSLTMLKWYVDGSHNEHWDCKGHGGAMFTLGKGATSSYSRKVKLASHSSTETELITVDMYMPEMLWLLYFIQGQGYEAECMGLHQDNISAQLLMKNGRLSSGKKTKHIKAKFFFIKDKVDDGEVQVLDCPTGEMWAEVLTKPLQGVAFRTMRAKLMNCAIDYQDEEMTNKSISTTQSLPMRGILRNPSKAWQECVEHKGLTAARQGTDRQVGLARIPRRSGQVATHQVRKKQ
jgi:hypothetical protein